MTLHIRGISAHYAPDSPVLRDITVDIAPGQVTSILGASGSGKTTLFRVLAGLHTPSAGTIHLSSADATTELTHLPAQRRRVGLVPQDGALFPHLTVAQNIAYGLRDVSPRAAAHHPRVRQYASLVGLEGLEDRLPHQLSGGQQQRVALARALAPQPSFVLLDEPFSSLDPELRQHLREELLAVLRTQRVPVILVTHDAYEALSSTDVIALLRHGCLEHVGSPQELYTAPRSTWAARLLGKASFLRAAFDASTATTTLGKLQLAAPAPPEATHVLIRPENLTLTRSDEAPGGADAGQPATVSAIQYYGHATLVELRLHNAPQEPLLIRVDPLGAPLHVGFECFIRVNSPLHAVIDN